MTRERMDGRTLAFLELLTETKKMRLLSWETCLFLSFTFTIRQDTDVTGQTKVLWKATTARNGVINAYNKHNRTHDVPSNNNKQTRSSLGEYICMCNKSGMKFLLKLKERKGVVLI